MSFAFRLDPVLKYRQRAEDTCAFAFAVALRSRAEAAERRDARVREIAVWRDAIRHAGARTVRGLEIQRLDEAATAAAREAEEATAALAEAGARVEAAREDLLRASRARRSLERLREIELAAHAELRATAERALLDELGGVRDAGRRAAALREAGR